MHFHPDDLKLAEKGKACPHCGSPRTFRSLGRIFECDECHRAHFGEAGAISRGETISAKRPWEALRISRRTWYRRMKDKPK